ncbi:MAG: gamma-glutamylcyclotransferase [Acidocella sp. 20-57-95]|nr:MAG: gamma-glutamylcyclotransferase [Acidocella sp. 20-57-95]OYV59227.1 MAG: gamma-glutamylcyclotransferase [Acidocella sp. 21-58-7]
MKFRSDAEMAALLEAILAAHEMAQDLWVFGYGSLIWNPAFEHVEKRAALLRGYHRRFCLRMLMGRGTPETPGLMLALDHGGACKGAAFRIAAPKIRQELGLLWQREMFGGAYNARWVNVTTKDGPIRAVTFVINRAHPRYIPEMSIEQTAALIATGCGDLGTCREYLENTISHLAAMGLRDSGLERIARALPNRP